MRPENATRIIKQTFNLYFKNSKDYRVFNNKVVKLAIGKLFDKKTKQDYNYLLKELIETRKTYIPSIKKESDIMIYLNEYFEESDYKPIHDIDSHLNYYSDRWNCLHRLNWLNGFVQSL